MSKRILIFSIAYHPYVGGAEVAVKEITDRIDPHDVEFELITLRFDATLPKEEKIGNVLVHRIGFAKERPTPEQMVRFPLYLNKVLYPVIAYRKAVSIYKQRPFDAFWSVMSYMGFPAVLFRMFYKKIPYILNLQDGDPIPTITSRLRIRIVYPLLKKVFTDAAMVQVLSASLGEFARSMGYRGEIKVVPNGVDVESFSRAPVAERIEAIKTKLSMQQDQAWLVTTSRLVRKNGVDTVIEAMALLPNNIHFLVIGTGPLESKYQNLAKEKGVSERVHFIGNIESANIPEYLHACDIFIRPSRTEAFGNSFVEAMAASLPVIATQVGGIQDFLFDIKRNPDSRATGFAVDVESPEQIAEQVLFIIENPESAQEVVRNAQALVQENYDWKRIAQTMKNEVIDRLVTTS